MKHIHFIGICGTAMASLAGLLKQAGYKVTGSDQNVYPPMSTQLESIGISIQDGYRAENLKPKPDYVIVGNVVRKDNPEAIALRELQIPYTSLASAIGEFFLQDKKSIVIAGTHGKSTSTSMMAWVLEEMQQNPSFLVGAIAKNFSSSFAYQKGPYFVIEGDEYDTAYFDKVPKFVHYKPYYTILNSIEFDHADIYRDLDHVLSAFRLLLEKQDPNGILLYNAEDKNIDKILPHCKSKMLSFGFSEEADYQAREIHYKGDLLQFSVYHKNSFCEIIQLPMIGKYNVSNAISVFSLMHAMGYQAAQIAKAFQSFQGVKRRQEVLGVVKGITVIEDFAHHPTAVKFSIEAVKERFTRVIAVFEPRSATSRRKGFQNDYALALAHADEVFIAKPFDQSRIEVDDRFSTQELVNQLGKNAQAFESVDHVIYEIQKKAQAGDAILIMSNGSFDGIYTKILNLLSSEEPDQLSHK